MGRYYPAYLDVQGRRCVVIGAGTIAERKVAQLLESGGTVTVVSPEATPTVKRWAVEGSVRWERRPYRQGDLLGAFLAITATDDESVNRAVHSAAEEHNVLLNVVDVPELCSFIAPAVVERGHVAVAISTAGTSPALARRLRELMEGSRPIDFGDPQQTTCRCMAWARAADVLAAVRVEIKKQNRHVNPEAWQEAMDSHLLDLVETGREEEAKERMLHALLDAAVS
jgi:siroheme synthase-like protein